MQDYSRNNPSEILALVAAAKNGDQPSLNQLALLVRPALHSFVLRSTLNKDLADDVVQEALMQMVKSISKLNNDNSFWPWLFRITSNKLNEVFSRKQKTNIADLGESAQAFLESSPDKAGTDASHAIAYNELAQAVVDGMANLTGQQRQIVSLRCFNDLSFAEIAQATGCTQANARVLFFRAKKALESHLVRSGFGSAMISAGLVLFGQVTSPAQASVNYSASVSSAMSETPDFSITNLFEITKAKIVTAAAGLICVTVPAFLYLTSSGSDSLLPQRSQVKSFHFVTQSWDNRSVPNINLNSGKSLSKGAYEQWFYFPQGVDGPLFMMMQRWDPSQKVKLCGWLQNDSGNHYYHSGQKTIYLYNYHLPLSSLKTRRFPTDSADFTDFLDRVEGNDGNLEYNRDPKTGLLTGALDDRFYNAPSFRTSIQFNNLTAETFGNFRNQWPSDTPIVDERDVMHKRGWTCFSVSGHVNGLSVRGIGQMPFIYNKLSNCPPALVLCASGSSGTMTIFDSAQGSGISQNGKPVLKSQPGIFFKGFARPWFGIHTLDLIRRDAALEKTYFRIKVIPSTGQEYQNVELTLYNCPGREQIELVYTIDTDKDVLEKIEFVRNSQSLGTLKFDYPDQVESLQGELNKQINGLPSMLFTKKQDLGIAWLFDFANGNLPAR